MNSEIINLPWQIQVALASGYAAYSLGYMGMREHHRVLDATFRVLIFSLFASGALFAFSHLGPVWSGAAAAGSACLSGILWRWFGFSLLRAILRKLDISWSDDAPSAWATLSYNSKFRITQAAVLLDDGTWLRCDGAGRFQDAPFGPITLGPNGDVAIYLTHEELIGQPAKELSTVRDPNYGDRITYIPAQRVKRVTLRYKAVK